MATIASLIVDVAANTEQLTRDVGQINGQLDRIGGTAMKVAGAFGIAFGVEAIIGFGKELFDLGSRLQDLKDRTGIGVESLQQLSEIAAESGSSIDALAASINQMQKRLSGEDSSAVSALKELGLSLSDLMAESPDRQFYDIAHAIAAIEDPAKQVELGWKLFGKSFGEVKATVLADMDSIKAGTAVMSADTSKWMDDLGDTLGRLARNAKVYAAETIAAIWSIPATEGERAKRDAEDAERLTKQMSDMATNAKSPFAAMLGQTAGAPLPTPDTGWINDFTRGVKVLIEANNEMAHWRETVRQATAFADGFGAVVERIDGKVLEGIRFYRERGTAMSDLAELYGLTKDQVEALNEQFRFEDSVAQATSKTFRDLRASVQEVQMPLEDLASEVLPEFNVQTADSVVRVGGLGQTAGEAAGQIEEARHSVDRMGRTLSDLSEILSGVHGKWAELGKIAIHTIEAVGKRLREGDILGAVVAAGAGIASAIGKLFGNNPEKQVNPIRQAFVDAAGGLDALNAHAHAAGITLDHLLDARTPEAYKKAIDELNAAFSFQDEAAKTLDDTIQKYGFDLTDLPKGLQTEKFQEHAAAVLKDFKVLTAGGIETGNVVTHMQKGFQDLLNESFKTGQGIPESLKPAYQRLVDMGLVTDEAGNKITDIGDIKFTKDLTDEFDSVIKKISDLIDAIKRIPGVVDINANVHTHGVPDVPDVPGVPDVPTVPEAAGGVGRVTRPTLFFSRGNEDFAFSGEGKRFSGGGETVIVVQSILDGKVVAESVNRANERDQYLKRKVRAA